MSWVSMAVGPSIAAAVLGARGVGPRKITCEYCNSQYVRIVRPNGVCCPNCGGPATERSKREHVPPGP